ncbi:hypothetical protein PINS_up022164 [Pythium insidiosum]|nr:hypothetical protein PINS_up022164 [Pythium insidiosum]
MPQRLATAALCVAAAAVSAASTHALPHANATVARHLDQCTPLPGVDIVGHDLSHAAGVAAAAECCSRCSALVGCQAYTWTPWNGGTCWFKSASQPTHANADAQSGAVARRQDDSDAQCRLQPGVDFSGRDLGDVAAATAGECCGKCRDLAGCRAFTWTNWSGGRCWLKSAQGDARAADGAVSAVVEKPANDQCTIERGVDFEGFDIGNAPGANAGECCQQCERDAACRAFSWTNFNGGTCWLKSARGTATTRAGVDSGVVAKPDDNHGQCKLERGVDFGGQDIGRAATPSAEMCCEQCAAKPGCAAFTWTNWNGGMCWFKSERGATQRNDGAVSGVVATRKEHVQYKLRRGEQRVLSVNLGSWLVGEYWMSTTSPAWKDAVENGNQRGWGGEYITMKYLGQDKGTAAFEAHRQSWITEKDIAEIASRGLNTVRVPVGFWIVNDDPSTESTEISRVYAKGALKYLDKLVNEWAVKYNLAVMLSLHSHQGSQNGYDHSAPQQLGTTSWSNSQDNVRNSLQFATYLAARYKDAPAFLGLQLMNEPSFPTSYDVLWDYYKKAYEQIRATGNDCIIGVSPMLQEQGPPVMDWFMPKPQYYNVWHEFHVYYKWGENEGKNEDAVINNARGYRGHHLDNWKGNPIYMGEWSLASPDSAPFHDRGKLQELAAVQLAQFEGAKAGWAFWSWRHDEEQSKLSQWSMRQLLREGVFTVPRQ